MFLAQTTQAESDLFNLLVIRNYNYLLDVNLITIGVQIFNDRITTSIYLELE